MTVSCTATFLVDQESVCWQVDIVAVSCSCFAPTPSMAAMLVNRCKFKESVLTYNLSGMGCSSSLICVDMVKHLLKARLTSPYLPTSAGARHSAGVWR